jgi:REP element-mobilizing transposase RayT
MNRGLSYQTIFQGDSDREIFIKLLGECHDMWGIRVFAYCLMDNHYHLFFQTPKANLSRVMRHLDGIYTQRYNRVHRRDGPLFRGRYKSIVVDKESYLLAVARYIHHNPVEAGLVQFPEQYEWSSCKEYVRILEGQKVPAWLEVGELLGRFPKSKRKEAFIEFMRSKIEEPEKHFYEKEHIKAVLGRPEFIERIKKKIKENKKSDPEVPQGRAYKRIDPEGCFMAIQKVYQITKEELIKSSRGKRNEARSMGMVICRKLGGMKLGEIARIYQVGNYSTVSSVIQRMSKEIEVRGKTNKRYEQIKKILQT